MINYLASANSAEERISRGRQRDSCGWWPPSSGAKLPGPLVPPGPGDLSSLNLRRTVVSDPGALGPARAALPVEVRRASDRQERPGGAKRSAAPARPVGLARERIEFGSTCEHAGRAAAHQRVEGSRRVEPSARSRCEQSSRGRHPTGGKADSGAAPACPPFGQVRYWQGRRTRCPDRWRGGFGCMCERKGGRWGCGCQAMVLGLNGGCGRRRQIR
jgi:hypothetical protein